MKKLIYLLLILLLAACVQKNTQQNHDEQVNATETSNKNDSQKEEGFVIPENTEKIGRWMDVRSMADCTLTLTKNTDTGKYYVLMEYGDGSYSYDEVVVTKQNNLTKFRLKEQMHMEWFIIESNGDLSMYSQNGKFGTALAY